ncbi:uncharacterized protein LOC133314370 [Gastrolobium bilobum]|uniref:uncharacterized protein LOC133314370 n=1 Tax=Gastrolobium bilobum TaxID=150636 RepID=UPI002AB0B904|nr:uncharacterized protein LOC133314370 [Gastrolobium bilobum]
MICFSCGKYGHKKEQCSSLSDKSPKEKPVKEGPNVNIEGCNNVEPVENKEQREGEEAFGSWMVVQRSNNSRRLKFLPAVKNQGDYSRSTSVVGNKYQSVEKPIVLKPGANIFLCKVAAALEEISNDVSSVRGNLTGGGSDKPNKVDTEGPFKSANSMGTSQKAKGVAKKGFLALIRDLKSRFNINILALLETKISGDKAQKLIPKFGFSNFVRQDPMGFSGGIWLCWDDVDFTLQVLKTHHQFIHSGIIHRNCSRVDFITFVYGSPRRCERRMLWQKMVDLGMDNSSSWIVLGDFNTLLSPNEKVGGWSFCWGATQEFRDCLTNCNLHGMGSKGPQLTWKRNNTHERLYRACVSEAWNTQWPNHSIVHLPFYCSNHRPLSWLMTRSETLSMVANRSSSLQHGSRMITLMTLFVTVGLTNQIGSLVLKNSKKTSRFGMSNPFEPLNRSLWRELETILIREELCWFQRAKCNWLEFGDRNTRFFHSTFVAKHRRNKIFTIKDDNGLWMDDPHLMMDSVVSFFERLFGENSDGLEDFPLSGGFPIIENRFGNIATIPSATEIKQAIFSMGKFKSPGPDGLSALFYQAQWHVIIANRLKNFLPNLIAPNQCSFIKRRNGYDNIVIAQEILHSMRRRKWETGWMAIKLDLDKAYDRLDWQFIHNTMVDIGLPRNLIHLIDECVQTPSMNLIWNGSTTRSFKPKHGLMQGDPISPYLFVMCVERLAHLIQAAIQVKAWKPIILSKKGPPVFHLLFADDIFLFAEASMEQAHLINQVLKTFYGASGQKVSEEKLKVHFSSNVGFAKARQISGCMGFGITMDLGRYLGMPLLHKRASKSIYAHILQKMKDKLNSWNQNALSFAGRITLAKSILGVLPTYNMQTSSLTISICNEIDRTTRDFIWGSSAAKRKVHLVGWDKVCSSKVSGGLGIRTSRLANTSSVMKIGHRILVEKNALWCKVLRAKYKVPDTLIPNLIPRREGSNL